MPKNTRNPLVHGSNLKEKENNSRKYNDSESKEFLAEIRKKYDKWSRINHKLIGPTSTLTELDSKIVQRRVRLLSAYKNFIDQQKYAEKFDSRSNLHSSVLEEFLYYLFKDLIADFGRNTLIGKSHTFKDIFFVPPNYLEMLKRPYARIEKKDHDFVIGTTIQITLESSPPPDQDEQTGKLSTIFKEEPENYSDIKVRDNAETQIFDLPIIVIECKTYLDKTMLEGSSRAAEDLKARNPNSLYIVVMEWIKLSNDVNLKKYKVDQIYVLRQQKNTDRELRYRDNYCKNEINPIVVEHLLNTVRQHLVTDWTGEIEHGIQRGWLI
jgi:Bpu10I restriction endonuclease